MAIASVVDADSPAKLSGLFLVDHISAGFGETISIRDPIAKWVATIATRRRKLNSLEVVVRAYGGWWREEQASIERSSAAAYYQDYCPSLLLIDGIRTRIIFEFADYLLADSSQLFRIDHTVMVRNRSERLRHRIGSKKCFEQNCGAPDLLRWIKSSSACANSACAMEFSSVFERLEQKQVDVHLSLDLSHAAAVRKVDELAVVSSDIDVSPAIIGACLGSSSAQAITLLRNGRFNRGMDYQMSKAGATLLEF